MVSRLASPAVSPNGARAVFTARGEVITVPAEKGDPRNLTNSPGVMERDPQWSPDGKTIAYLSDESGEYALHLEPQSGAGEIVKIALKPGFYTDPRFSPDSKKIAGPLAAGKKTVAHLAHDKACLFDLHAVFEDGAVTDAQGVELCKDKKINLTE